jgi:3-hydroxyisobutyrate dehydrogenase-like beta-hydroxyacid dehydrogenase
MGATVGAALRAGGADVRWATAGRSEASHERAEAAGLIPEPDLVTLVDTVDLIVSVCPPAAALAVAEDVMDAGFRGRYLDANAIAPATARRIGDVVTRAGGHVVDGGIVGPPATEPGTTRLYLSGDDAADVAALFAAGPLEAVVVPGSVGAASAVKMAYAGWTKGSSALLLAMRAYARSEDVEEVLLAEWDRSQPDLRERSDGLAARIHRKAWRFDGEMREIAAALDAAGLPRGFHDGAADVYAHLADLREHTVDQDPGHVLDRLSSSPRRHRS